MNVKGTSTITQINGSHLIVESLRDEMVIYDRRTNKAHMLDARAAAIWNATENGCTFDDLLPLVEGTTEEKRKAMVQLAISDLESAGLLMSGAPARMPRRGLIKTLGTAVALPLVISILAPAPAAAQSNLADGAICPNMGVGDSCVTAGRMCVDGPVADTVFHCCAGTGDEPANTNETVATNCCSNTLNGGGNKCSGT